MQGLRCIDLIAAAESSQPQAQVITRDARKLCDTFSFPLLFRIPRRVQNVKATILPRGPAWGYSWTLVDRNTVAKILRDKIVDLAGFKAHNEEYAKRKKATKRENQEYEAAEEEKRKRGKVKEAEKEEKRQEKRQKLGI
ncbi:MAG: hypothetical protein Q9223_004353 [Gallowayella weberi]